MAEHNEKGKRAEDLAKDWLTGKGYIFREANYRYSHSEIDLIFEYKGLLVFVEVKFRRSNHFGGAAAAVTLSKQQKLTRTAQCYLQSVGQQHCRFDVVAITEQPADIRWIKNAFAGTAN